MAIRVNPKLIDQLEKYGTEDVTKCYHCGNCSAVCPHADEVFVFPRRSMRTLQMGLEIKLRNALEPWLCYYCGQCSEQCPRDAEPGETMMGLRRWLISRYDFTGLARRFFESAKTEIFAIVLVALLSGIGFLFYGFSHGDIRVYDGKQAFLSSYFIHNFDLALGLLMVIFLGVNAFRMWRYTMLKIPGLKIPWWIYPKKILLLPWHFITQQRYAKCEDKTPKRIFIPWFVHLGLMLGYVTMLVLVMVFLHLLQSGPAIKWQVHAFGYLATIGLTIGLVYMIRGRLKKTQVQYQRSHSSDWVFLVLLLIIVTTGILQHVFHRTNVPVAANITYVIHLMAVVPWLLRMPFSKWAHLLYRPLAMFFAAIRKEAVALQLKKKESFPKERIAA